MVLNGSSRRHGLSEATQNRVLAAARELDYVPNHAARALRRRRTGIVTLLTSELGNPFFAAVAAAAAEAAGRRGYALDVLAATTEAAGVEALRRLRAGGTTDGVAVHGGSARVRAEVAQLRARGIGCVLVQDAGPEPDLPCVRVDLRGGARLAVQHLLSLGHRRVAHLTDGRLPRGGDGNDRLAGYRDALHEAGLPFDPALVIPADNSPAGGAAATTHALLRQPAVRATALFAFNDQMAVGALHALHEAGLRVPNDMAVVGFDGTELGGFTLPPLTTVAHPRRDLGSLAVETLLDLLEGAPPARPVLTLPARLLIRRSCGAHPHHPDNDPEHPGTGGHAP